MRKGTFTGVGLGPGDPELITLKGLRALENADVIFYPASKIDEEEERSFSSKILSKLNILVESRPLLIPMTGKDRDKHYREAFKKIQREVLEGKSVVMVSEGDLLFYSTFGYIFKLAKMEDMDCNLIPGIPAFIASGSQGDSPIVEGISGFRVIARPKDFQQIESALNEDTALVVMKMSVLQEWYPFLRDCKHPFLYVEQVGTDQQFTTSNASDIEFRSIPYFSLIIFYN